MYEAINIAIHLADIAAVGVLVANMLQSALLGGLGDTSKGEVENEHQLEGEEPP